MHAAPKEILQRFLRVRATTEALCAPLSAEDQQIQSMALCSPAKWHRAHTTWFFETFVLLPVGLSPYDNRFGRLFNSYYDGVGDRIARGQRGLLSRPSSVEVAAYRRAVDGRVIEVLESIEQRGLSRLLATMELGLAHEEQHQELILTDALHALSLNPLLPAYRPAQPRATSSTPPTRWVSFTPGVIDIGAKPGGFSFDNERPRHRVYLEPYELATRPVSVREVKEFILARGYKTPSLWLSAGYEIAQAEDSQAPLYAAFEDGLYRTFSLGGVVEPHDDDPACFLSFFEADAIARFLGARLSTEAEWEHAAESPSEGMTTLFGDVWQWTRSSYEPYPGFTPDAGVVGEYNGKFMAQQMVLRGGSCFTPCGHVRASYRNFWPPETRHQMAGVRLARDVR